MLKWFKKMTSKKSEETINIKFFTVSGISIILKMKKADWKENLEVLSTDWKRVISAGEKWGINFALVTHYEVIDA